MSNNSRTKYLKALFAYFQENDIPFCVVGDTEKMPYSIPGDIDIVIGNEYIRVIIDRLANFSKHQNAKFVQVFKHEQTAFYFILAWVNDDCNIDYLHPDICSDYFRNGKLFLSADDILNGREMAVGKNGTAKGFFVPRPGMEFIYYLIKKIEKGAINQDQFRHLFNQFNQYPEECFSKLLRFWSFTESESIQGWLRDGDLNALQNAIPRLHKFLEKKCRSSIIYRWREFIRKVHRVLQPTGLFIVLIGPDGCGKSTIGKHLHKELAPAFRGVKQFHLRPYFFGSVREKLNNAPVTNPHEKKPRGFFASIAKLLYFFFDYTAGYLFRVRPLKVRSNLILFDRYYHDMLIDPLRYRYGAPVWATRLFSMLLPEPDLFLVLDAPPEVIQTRKQEVPLAETIRQRQSYLTFAQSKQNCIIINTEQPIKNTVLEATKALLNYMEKRMQTQIGAV